MRNYPRSVLKRNSPTQIPFHINHRKESNYYKRTNWKYIVYIQYIAKNFQCTAGKHLVHHNRLKAVFWFCLADKTLCTFPACLISDYWTWTCWPLGSFVYASVCGWINGRVQVRVTMWIFPYLCMLTQMCYLQYCRKVRGKAHKCTNISQIIM